MVLFCRLTFNGSNIFRYVSGRNNLKKTACGWAGEMAWLLSLWRGRFLLAIVCLWQATPLHSTTSAPSQRSPSLPHSVCSRRLGKGQTLIPGLGPGMHPPRRIRLRGGGDEGGEGGDGTAGWGTLDMNTADPVAAHACPTPQPRSSPAHSRRWPHACSSPWPNCRARGCFSCLAHRSGLSMLQAQGLRLEHASGVRAAAQTRLWDRPAPLGASLGLIRKLHLPRTPSPNLRPTVP